MATAEHLCIMLVLYVCTCSCMSDYYSLLGVPRSASMREIKKAFHKLALKHHPDKNQSPNAQQAFTHIAQAYEVLSSKESRRVYDQTDYITNPDQSGDSRKMGNNPFDDKEGFYGKNGFEHFSLQELLRTLRLDADFFMDEESSFEGWSYNYGADDDDEQVFLGDLFNML
ncbi:dnaJ homolog subfamily B member 9 [Misgurnus anguillicaudatus]|uniref:dnaJ homolog subfamily B member 9 n=1 Tax=Misgurnus anguillicaudatus TaxID=75329 RepID=UPI003CCFC6A8